MTDLLEKARIAFTGKMASMTRREAWRLVREMGAEPTSYVSPKTALLIVGMEGWPLLPDGSISLKLRRAEELRRAGCPIRIAAEPVFLEMVGRLPSSPSTQKAYPAAELCRIMKVGTATLQRWERCGLIQSKNGCYDFQDMVSIQAILDLVNAGVRPERIARSLLEINTVFPGLERPLAQLRIIANNPETLFVDLGGKHLSTGGQLLFNFEGRRAEGTVLSADFGVEDPIELFELGLDFEEDELYPEAAAAFQAVLSIDPSFGQAFLHLGNTMRAMGRLWAAEDCYRAVTQIEPDMASGWCGLAAVQEERGKIGEAIASYEAAIAACPDYSEGHFNLALCYEKAGRRPDACKHWFAYLKLDPASPSAQVAKKHLILTNPALTASLSHR